MSFVEEFNRKFEERDSFLKIKEQEMLDNVAELKAAKEELEKANKEYFLLMSNETLINLKNAKSKLKEVEDELRDSEEELSQLKRNFLFVYDSKAVYSEVKEIYANSGLEQDIKRKNKLESELEKLKTSMFEKWLKVEDEVSQITGKINKLYLSDNDRIRLCEKIDNYIGAGAWKLVEEGINAYHTSRRTSDLLINSMDKENNR